MRLRTREGYWEPVLQQEIVKILERKDSPITRAATILEAVEAWTALDADPASVLSMSQITKFGDWSRDQDRSTEIESARYESFLMRQVDIIHARFERFLRGQSPR